MDYKKLRLDGTRSTLTFLDPGTSIDLGAIAKGYIADQLKAYLLDSGVESAMINLGGNVLCVGSRPDGHAVYCGAPEALCGPERDLCPGGGL